MSDPKQTEENLAFVEHLFDVIREKVREGVPLWFQQDNDYEPYEPGKEPKLLSTRYTFSFKFGEE